MVPDRLTAIFEKQRELTNRFHNIELENRILRGSFDRKIPVDLLGFSGQETIRSHAWRVVEEVAEVLDARERSSRADLLEEVSDVFHFVVELMIVSGLDKISPQIPIPPDEPQDPLTWIFEYAPDSVIYSDAGQAWLDFLRSLGMALHELKWRAWKKTPLATDVRVFHWKLNDAFHAFIAAVKVLGFSADELHAAYFSKNQVNHGRIDATG